MMMIMCLCCSQAWDLLSWAKDVEQEMLSEKVVRDVSGADLLRTRHEEIRAEIEARQDTFDLVITNGDTLVENQHYAADEVRVMVVLSCSFQFCLPLSHVKYIPTKGTALFCLLFVCVCVCVCAVSYTHLTLPTRRSV